MLMNPINVQVLDNGNLLLTAGNAARQEVKEVIESSGGFYHALADVLEDYWANGIYYPFDASDGNPFVGLTAAPCIAEELDVLDDGEKVIHGRFWYFAEYMLYCPLEQLANKGRVVFTLAQ